MVYILDTVLVIMRFLVLIILLYIQVSSDMGNVSIHVTDSFYMNLTVVHCDQWSIVMCFTTDELKSKGTLTPTSILRFDLN